MPQVTGELSNNGEPMRRFMQTFVLAPQTPKKFYVHNDIFRYQDEVYQDNSDTESEDHQPLEAPPVVGPSSSATTLVNTASVNNVSSSSVSSNSSGQQQQKTNMPYYQSGMHEANVVVQQQQQPSLSSSSASSTTDLDNKMQDLHVGDVSKESTLHNGHQSVEIVAHMDEDMLAVEEKAVVVDGQVLRGQPASVMENNHVDVVKVSVENGPSELNKRESESATQSSGKTICLEIMTGNVFIITAGSVFPQYFPTING